MENRFFHYLCYCSLCPYKQVLCNNYLSLNCCKYNNYFRGEKQPPNMFLPYWIMGGGAVFDRPPSLPIRGKWWKLVKTEPTNVSSLLEPVCSIKEEASCVWVRVDWRPPVMEQYFIWESTPHLAASLWSFPLQQNFLLILPLTMLLVALSRQHWAVVGKLGCPGHPAEACAVGDHFGSLYWCTVSC